MTEPTPDKPTAASVRADLIAEQDALDAVVAPLDDDLWALPTPSPRWTIADQIGHLTYFDWTAALAITDEDGRAKELLPGGSSAGVYTLVFDTGAYFEQAGIATFYPEVSVTFSVLDVDAHHHVPLLLSPFAYSTYRGS